MKSASNFSTTSPTRPPIHFIHESDNDDDNYPPVRPPPPSTTNPTKFSLTTKKRTRAQFRSSLLDSIQSSTRSTRSKLNNIRVIYEEEKEEESPKKVTSDKK